MKKVDAQMNFPELEKQVLEHWKEQQIFEKSVNKDAPNGDFVFYDGPPFATGLPHYGHLLQSIVKDIFPRYKTMTGHRVERRWGWDCHGLPIENLVEKELGFKNKKDIEEYGIEKFNELCRSKVLQYASDWKVYVERLGRFVDMEHSYFTMSPEYMESVWWVWKSLWEKGLVYESYRTMHICPRCETTLSQAEVSEGYKDVKDLAVTAKFELVDSIRMNDSKESTSNGVSEPKTYMLAWTTTPWTLPGNVALAVGKDIEYVKISFEESLYIVAKDLVEKVFIGKEYELKEEIKGEDLIGKSYIPPFRDYFEQTDLENRENGWKVYHADFITTDMGTGIAHEAPAFGEDDMLLGKEHNLPWVQHVAMDGTIKPEVKEFASMQVKPLDNPQAFDIEIIKALAGKGLLFAKEKYEHSYPHCWRCDTPLLNYATGSWFVAVEKIKEEMLENAKEINWSPEHVKAGRFGKWLEGARDWSVSRQRFWASCIPLWECACGEREVIGSVKELEAKCGEKVEDLHKHTIDKLTWSCGKCGGEMKRIPDVLDTWFDSGSMPYAMNGYTGEGEITQFPADFIAEMVEQTRTWFYYQHVLGVALYDQPVFKNAVATGVILAEDGRKMSKKLQNYPDPMHIFDTYGADALRLYITTSPVVQAENLNFSEKDLQTMVRNTFRMLWNSYSFFTTYASIDKWSPHSEAKASENILDRWLLSELQVLIEKMTEELENYKPAQAARLIAPFVDDLSNWYIRRSRKRFWKNENDDDKEAAYQTLHTVLVELAKLMAPFTPFIAEEMYRNLTDEESVHLAGWPVSTSVDVQVSNQMDTVRTLVTLGLQLRSDVKIKVRQPLQSVSVKFDLEAEFQEILKDELNIKEVFINQNQQEFLIFDSEITPELKLEGEMREIIRAIQEGRKKAGFNVEDRIILGYSGKEEVFGVHQDEIAHEVLATEVKAGELENTEYNSTVDIEGGALTFWLKRV
ncbi:MAG: isoleucine--tRNA ligase [Candidatus Moranbacteria bacterium]|nr:isoleucine--tRNA ligase [Candidatus Moranbacteria bacterium]